MKRACLSRPTVAVVLAIGLAPIACGAPSQRARNRTAVEVREAPQRPLDTGSGSSPPVASESAATLVEAGSYTALVGGAAAGVGVLLILGAVALGGPAYDHSDVIRGGGVTFLVGTGVSALGGLMALGGYTASHPQGGPATIGQMRD